MSALIQRAIRVLVGAMATLGCVEYPDYEPLGEGVSGPISGGSPADEVGDTDTGMAAGCDPFADPSEECGAGNTCDPETGECRAATGTTMLSDACASEGAADPCAPGLICREGRCRQPCDPSGDLQDPDAKGSCPSTDTCVLVGDSYGVCLASCSLVEQDCTLSGEACNRAQGVEDIVAACTRNLGIATENEPCASDGDCLAGLLCTPQAQHENTCASMAASCCANICDEQLGCFGLELFCNVLGIPDQMTAGYCGA